MIHNQFSIIVVEDEKLIAKNIVKNIERASDTFTVVATAFDGAAALELIDTYMPDVVFTDIKMPVLDGLELIKQIGLKYPQIKTVIISGYNDFKYAQEAMAHKTCNYLLKPINFLELENTLTDLQQSLIADRGKLAGFQKMNGLSTKEIVDAVKEYIDKNYCTTIDFTIIARNLSFSLSYLSKVFSKQVEVSPTRYMINLRTREAKKLLKKTTLTVKQIAESLGYVDQFYFSKSFKNEVGLSPNNYRGRA